MRNKVVDTLIKRYQLLEENKLMTQLFRRDSLLLSSKIFDPTHGNHDGGKSDDEKSSKFVISII